MVLSCILALCTLSVKGSAFDFSGAFWAPEIAVYIGDGVVMVGECVQHAEDG